MVPTVQLRFRTNNLINSIIHRRDKEWQTHIHHRPVERRGVGVAEMMQAIAEDLPHRANGQVALHVVDIMESIHRAGATGLSIHLSTSCEQPLPFQGLPPVAETT